MRTSLSLVFFSGIILPSCSPRATDVPRAQVAPRQISTLLVMPPKPTRGFHWPYYLYVPWGSLPGKAATMLVLPNNTGTVSDDYAVHEASVQKKALNNRILGERLGMVMLRPVFPRPKAQWKLYTHALDRDTLFEARGRLERLDRQLIAMIEDARRFLRKRGVSVRPKVMMYGFSASGMFVNRFTLLHPARVCAAAIGSPGGWPIAPIARHEGRSLSYPVGIADLLAQGIRVDLGGYLQVPLFFFQGADDNNDSVAFQDGYDPRERDLVNELFGKNMRARWGAAARLYRRAGCNCRFQEYPGIGHKVDGPMLKDVLTFLSAPRNACGPP